ncbi:hypothetical protein [Clavibacter capsici]|uniref:hypothetical protein n=1 Tax=Clavibacter capsici TaxID=1874630 RepID=UPI0035C9B29E
MGSRVRRHGSRVRRRARPPPPPRGARTRRALPRGRPRHRRPAPSADPVDAVLVPYALWGNRDAGAMRVWIRAADTG